MSVRVTSSGRVVKAPDRFDDVDFKRAPPKPRSRFQQVEHLVRQHARAPDLEPVPVPVPVQPAAAPEPAPAPEAVDPREIELIIRKAEEEVAREEAQRKAAIEHSKTLAEVAARQRAVEEARIRALRLAEEEFMEEQKRAVREAAAAEQKRKAEDEARRRREELQDAMAARDELRKAAAAKAEEEARIKLAAGSAKVCKRHSPCRDDDDDDPVTAHNDDRKRSRVMHQEAVAYRSEWRDHRNREFPYMADRPVPQSLTPTYLWQGAPMDPRLQPPPPSTLPYYNPYAQFQQPPQSSAFPDPREVSSILQSLAPSLRPAPSGYMNPNRPF